MATFRNLPCQLTLPSALAETQEVCLCPLEPQNGRTLVSHFSRVALVCTEPSSAISQLSPDQPTTCYRKLSGSGICGADVRQKLKISFWRRENGMFKGWVVEPTGLQIPAVGMGGDLGQFPYPLGAPLCISKMENSPYLCLIARGTRDKSISVRRMVENFNGIFLGLTRRATQP